ncbi:MAG: hypothetical protein JXR91_11270 [Deltaproteobacteria bacterium]|nr:hypothetical protein [Deltaproteobacteria bacterium]
MPVKEFVLLLFTFLFISCGGAKVTPQNPEDENKQNELLDSDSLEVADNNIEITENSKLVVTLEAKLEKKYRDMKLSDEINELLVSHHIDFNIPEGFKLKDFSSNSVWDYDLSIIAESSNVEIRFKIMDDEPEYFKDNKGDSIDPSKAVSNELMALLMKLNGGSLIADMQQHPEIEAKTRFNAACYSTASFEPAAEFATYEIGSAGIFYKEGHGRVIVISLINGFNIPQSRTEWSGGSTAMRFVEP